MQWQIILNRQDQAISNNRVIENLRKVLTRIRELELRHHRLSNSVKLLAVSKGRSIDDIHAAYLAGQKCFGESYVQEALDKIIALPNDIEWHFIGKIQANKTKLIAKHFAWVHSLSRLKIAERLNAQRPKDLPFLNVCVEINISREETKSGIHEEELLSFTKALKKMPRLVFRGLMVIPKYIEDENEQLKVFQRVRNLQYLLEQNGIKADILSMGMSHDYPAAIAAGSNIVRIGTAIFDGC